MVQRKVLIATPAYGHSVLSIYHESVLALVKHYAARTDVSFDSKIVSLAAITVARNFLASYFLERAEYTHLLFIDADMGFRPSLIDRMLGLDVPVAGTFYPARSFDPARLHAVSRKIEDPALAARLAQDFIGDPSWIVPEASGAGDGKTFKASVKNGFVRTRRCGTGIMLIARSALGAIKLRYPELWVADCGAMYRGLGLTQGVLQCFETIRDQSGIFVGEDMAFCQRWVEGCGGEIWANVSEDVSHMGTFANTGNFLTRLQHPQDAK